MAIGVEICRRVLSFRYCTLIVKEFALYDFTKIAMKNRVRHWVKKNNTGEKNTPNYISYLSIYELYKNKLNNI